MTALFAAEHTFHVGGDVGYSTVGDENTVGGGIVFDYTKVHDSGFSFKAEFINTTPDYFFTGVGFGFSPIANEKMTLSFFGDVGICSTILGIGADAMFTYRFTRHVGIFGGAGYYSGCPFVGKLGAAFTIHPRGE